MQTQTLIHADIFFFIASIGFIVITLLIAVGLVYVIRILRGVRRITDKIEQGINTAEEDVKELISDLRESSIFRMIFGGRKRKAASTTQQK